MLEKIHKKNERSTPPILSIVTVVKDDSDGLQVTAISIEKNLPRDESFEYVVWINSSTTDMEAHLSTALLFADVVVVAEDKGIFDSMNRAAQHAIGNYLLFLNARDQIIEPFSMDKIKGPSLIPVQYIDYFGKKRNVKVARYLQMGIPFCHQGMILPREGYTYNTSYKYGADYLALLNFNLDWPLPLLQKGLVEYDTTGISTVNRWEADKWTAKVIHAKFGWGWRYAYLAYCLSKLAVKRLFALKRKVLKT